MMKFVRCGVAALMLSSSVVAAQDYEAGVSAYNAGDYASALQEWLPLAEQGNAIAQFGIAGMYENGWGVPQDFSLALNWYRQSAEQGNLHAQNYLGLIYAQGKGVTQDYTEAVRWYRLAAEQGNTNAQYNLGVMYAQGKGVPQDYVTAHMWFNIVAASGDETAAENREVVARWMTPADISEAQRRARVCVNSGYQDCD